MKTLKNFFTKHHGIFNLVCSVALAFATVAANTRCAYIYHNPQKPADLQKLKKF